MSLLLAAALALSQDTGVVEFSVFENGKPVPCRVHVTDAAGKPVKVPGRVAWNDHHVIDGTEILELRDGAYRIEIERGPEYGAEVRELRVIGGSQKQTQFQM